MMSEYTTSYYDNDFDIVEWSSYCEQNYTLPVIADSLSIEDQANQWNNFYEHHSGGNFFKMRKYLAQEFKKWFENSRTVIEIGCGYGCSIFPLVDTFPGIFFVGSDYSDCALDIMSKHPKFDPDRMRTVVWDVCNAFPDSTVGPVDAALMIFVLSAVPPAYHATALSNIREMLCEGGVVLFRDYGHCDMTMYRHVARLEPNLYQRSDGTLSFYFDLDYITRLCDEVGLKVVELKYATVLNRNRKKGIDMHRVFVHAVLQK